MHGHRSALSAVVVFSLAAIPQSAIADDYFVESDDYTEGEEITGTFLQHEDYSIMIESLERNGVEFDWGWARTAGWSESSPPPEPPQRGLKKLTKRFKRSGPGTVQEPRELGFDLRSYSTAYVAPAKNSAGILEDDFQAKVEGYLARGLEEFGLRIVDAREGADIELGIAIVDINGNTTRVPVYGIQVDPFIEIELRLRDLRTGRNLLLLRNQSHSNSPLDAALRYVNQFVQFLR